MSTELVEKKINIDSFVEGDAKIKSLTVADQQFLTAMAKDGYSDGYEIGGFMVGKERLSQFVEDGYAAVMDYEYMGKKYKAYCLTKKGMVLIDAILNIPMETVKMSPAPDYVLLNEYVENKMDKLLK